MKICMVSPFSHDIRIVPRLQFAINLVKKGHKVFFITPREQYIRLYMGLLPNNMYENFQGVEIFYFKAKFPFLNIAYPLPNLFEEIKLICNIIEQERVDIIHFYQPEFLTSIPLPLIKKKYNKPILLTVNGFPGISWFYGSPIVDFIGFFYTHIIARFLMRYADKILLFARDLKLFAINLGVSEKKLIYLPQGVHLEIPCARHKVRNQLRMELGISDNEKVITFTGRLAPVKGVNFLIMSFKRLYKKMPNCKLFIVGDGPDRKLYEMQSGSLLNKNIFFTGMVKPEKVLNYLLASDIFVLPSISEGIPSSLLEACFCGLPCIATAVGAIPDIIKNGKTGIIIKNVNADHLYKALLFLINNEIIAKKMGEQAKINIENIFTWDKIIEKYEHICLEQLSQGS